MEARLCNGIPQATPGDKWQIIRAMHILRRHERDDEWAKWFIGNWPVYTLGYFMSSADDIHLVRRDLHRRWELTKFSQITRFIKGLEATWSGRGYRVDVTT